MGKTATGDVILEHERGGLHRWPTGSSRGPATAMSVPGARGEEGDEATMKRRDLRPQPRLTLDRDGHWHGQCVTRAQSGQFGSPTRA